MPAPRSERSRSPRAERAERAKSPQAKFNSKFELGTWVLFRPTPKTRWADANPALISKVVSALQKADVRCSVIIPNLLTLRHGYGGSHFKEVNDVDMKYIKAYTGADKSHIVTLKEQLLTAIKNDRAERAKRIKVKAERRVAEDTSALSSAFKPEEVKLEKPEEKTKAADDFQTSTTDGQAAVEKPLKFDVIKSKGVPLEKGDLSKGDLPEGGSKGEKMDDDSKAANMEDAKPAKMQDAKPGKLEDEGPIDIPCVITPKVGKMDLQRLEDFTRSVARAFGRQSMITRQDLTVAQTVVELKLTGDELAEGLTVLEEQNKIFMSNDLIFAI